MPSKRSYNRFFIILQEDQKGYGIDINKTPSGYAKLEVRNDRAKTSFYVQDIKKQSGPYYMVLIAQGNSGTRELINLGQINIDEGGRSDVSNEYDASNIANTNIGMDKIQGAGICRINGTKVSPVMVGFICGEELKNWATYPISKCGDKATKSTTTNVKASQEIIKKEVEQETRSLEEEKRVKQEKQEKQEDSQLMEQVKETFVEKKDDKVEELNEHASVSTTEVETQDFDEYEQQIERVKENRRRHDSNKCKNKHDHHEHHEKDEYPVGPMGEFFKGVVESLEKVGTKDSIKNCIWYKAHVKSLDDMYCESDYNKYSVIFYPMICYYPYIARSQYFMIGYKCDDEGILKYIIYAIPGTKSLIDQPYEGKTGFVTFMSDEENSKKGYWLMYYDVKKNSVVVPVKTIK